MTLKTLNMIPRRLYKYRHFNAQTMELLVTDQLFFGAPASFNDPLDTKPELQADMSLIDMEALLRKMVINRVRAQMIAAAKSIKYQGPKTIDHIERHSSKEAEELLAYIAFSPFNEDHELPTEEMRQTMIAHRIQNELLQQYDKGVFCLAESEICSLMWSHYGDQHHGICVGYDIPPNVDPIHKVDYERSRNVQASLVANMLEGNLNAKATVDSIVLATKADSWSYENEWRMLGTRGVQPSILELKEITFGLRCPQVVQHCVIKALEGLETEIDYFQIFSQRDDFRLLKYEVNLEELGRKYPSRSAAKYFGKITK